MKWDFTLLLFIFTLSVCLFPANNIAGQVELYNLRSNNDEQIFSLEIPTTSKAHSLGIFTEDIDDNWNYSEYTILANESLDWLIMVYLDGDNDLEENAIIDFNELEEGYSDLSSIKIIVLFDRILGYDDSNNDWTETQLYQIESDATNTINSLLLENKGELNMASNESLTYLVNYGFQNFDAEHYWLNLWNHGAGVNGVCVDETNSNDILTLEEMQSAINTSEELYNKNLDLISIDACNMGMIEVAYELRNLTDYFVSSEETIPLDGFDYYTIISSLIATPASPAINLIDFIIESYEDYYSIQSYSTTISAFNLSTELIIDLRLSIDILVDALLTAINDSYGSIIEEAFFNTQTFSYGYTIDLVDFLNALANSTLQVNYPEVQTKILLLKTVLNKIIFQNYQHDSFNGRANGASIFMPYYDTSYAQSIDDYISGVNSFIGMDWQSETLWEEFLFYFYSNGFGQGIPGLIQIEFGEPTGTIAIDEDEDHLYYFIVDNIGVYEITAEISSGDSDIYLIDYSDLSLLGYSLLVNPDDGNQEIMRFLLSQGTYLIDVYGFTASVYNLEVTESEIPPLLFDSTITEESGTQEGTDDGHYLQTVSYFYALIISTQGPYEIRLSYDGSEVDFDLYVYSMNFSLLDSSISAGDLDSISLDLEEPTILFVEVYGYSGNGQFTLQAINKNTNTPMTSTPPTTSPTPSVGLVIIPFIIFASSLVITLIYVKRKR